MNFKSGVPLLLVRGLVFSVLKQPFISLQKFVGKINSFTLVVPAARLYSRAACLAMSRALKSPRAIPVSSDLRQELEHWRFLDSWFGFLPWKDEKHFQLTVFSDA